MIRPATKEDIPEIVHIEKASINETEIVGYAAPIGERILADENKLRAAWVGDSVDGLQVYVFEQERILGFILIRVDNDAVELDDILVSTDRQNKGIGKALVAFVEDLARKLGKKYVTLGTTRSTKTGMPWKSYTFWLRLGYKVEEEKETEEGRTYGFTEIRFRKKL